MIDWSILSKCCCLWTIPCLLTDRGWRWTSSMCSNGAIDHWIALWEPFEESWNTHPDQKLVVAFLFFFFFCWIVVVGWLNEKEKEETGKERGREESSLFFWRVEDACCCLGRKELVREISWCFDWTVLWVCFSM